MSNYKMKKLHFLMLTLLVLAACNNNSSIAPSSSSIRPSTSITTSSSSTSSSSETNDERYAIYIKAQAAGFTGTYQEWLDSIKGADGTSLLNGATNPTSTLGKNGDTYINTSTWDVYVKSGGNWTKVGNILGTKGTDGLTPHIGTNGNWWIGTTDTNVPATGPSGTTPNIGNNGNWWIGSTDTGVSASASISSTIYTVTFKPENGQANFTQQVNQYHLVTKPTNPTKADHQFIGWFTDLDEQWVFSGYPLTQNLTLTAKYQTTEVGTEGLVYSTYVRNGKVEYLVSDYIGTDSEVIIPSRINGFDITMIGPAAFLEKGVKYSTGIPNSSIINSLSLPESIVSIGDLAFSGTNIESMTIPNNVSKIGAGAFYYSTIKSIYLSDNISEISDMTFGNTLLESIVIPFGVTKIGKSAFVNAKLTSLTLSNSISIIDNDAFYGNQLNSVIIPNSVTTIGWGAFSSNPLTSVTIPNSVTTIGPYAFLSSQALTIYVEAAVKPQGWDAIWFNEENNPVTVIWDYKNQ